MGETFGADAEWEENLINMAYDIDLPIEAVILNKPSKIFDVAKLKVGNTIMIDHNADDDVIVRSSDVDIFKGQLGKIENNVAISITDILLNNKGG